MSISHWRICFPWFTPMTLFLMVSSDKADIVSGGFDYLSKQHASFVLSTILDKSPWDSLKIWHVFANRSVFDALEGRVCAKWRPPSPLVNVAPKKCTFSPLIQHWEGKGEGEIEEGRFSAKKCRCPNTFVQDCLSWTTKTKMSITSQWFIVLPPNLDYWVSNGLIGIVLARDVCDYDVRETEQNITTAWRSTQQWELWNVIADLIDRNKYRFLCCILIDSFNNSTIITSSPVAWPHSSHQQIAE